MMYPLSSFLNNTGFHKTFATFTSFAFFVLSMPGSKAGTMINAMCCPAESTPKATQSLQEKKMIKTLEEEKAEMRQTTLQQLIFYRRPSAGKQCLSDVPDS